MIKVTAEKILKFVSLSRPEIKKKKKYRWKTYKTNTEKNRWKNHSLPKALCEWHQKWFKFEISIYFLDAIILNVIQSPGLAIYG